MYVYLNDISLNYPIDQSGNSFALISEVMNISNYIWDEYSIEFIKVPEDFKDRKIANHYSIKELIKEYEDDSFADLRFKLIDFLGNRVFTEIDEIEEEIIKEIESKKAWIKISIQGADSILLTGAYLLSMPTISFRTDSSFEVNDLPCQYHIEYAEEKTKTKDVSLKNLYTKASAMSHQQFLIEIKKTIKFGVGNWNPVKTPIWNEKTQELIQKMEFPQSLDGRKNKISELKEVGELIAVLNGWTKDNMITKLNRSKDHIRLIFTTYTRPGTAYLSIDMKNPKGCFEHYDYRGEHLGEISFKDGKAIPRGTSETGKDSKGKHNLKLKKD